MKIIIIGSGIAGLTLGLACQRHGMQVTIYEKAKELQNIGGGILLWPHGLRYLDWLGLVDCLKPFHVDVMGFDIISDKGKKIFHEDYAELYSLLGGCILPLDRSLFQQALVTQLKPGTLQLAKQCVKVCSDELKAQVYFADGAEDSADIIVGADGIYSAVRQYINPHAMHHYTEYCWLGGIVDQKAAPFFPADKACITMGLNKLLVAWPTANQRIMWYLPIKMSLENYAKDFALEKLESICADWLPEIQQLVLSTSNRQRFYLPIHTLAPQTLSRNRVVLIGDAAHTLGPILGQGASQAIEDAYLLFHLLQQMDCNHEVLFAAYTEARLRKYHQLAVLENQTAETMVYDKQEELDEFQRYIHELSLVTMYQELIPLVNEAYCEKIRQLINAKITTLTNYNFVTAL